MFEVSLLLKLIVAYCFGEVKPRRLNPHRLRYSVEEGNSR